MWKKNWMLLPGILLVPFGLSADITGQTDWLLLPSGGTYAWDGNHQHPLVGSNIGLSSVQGVGTGDNSGITLSILYGSMNFSSGPYNDNGPKLELGRG